MRFYCFQVYVFFSRDLSFLPFANKRVFQLIDLVLLFFFRIIGCQQRRSYNNRTSVYSIIRITEEAQARTKDPRFTRGVALSQRHRGFFSSWRHILIDHVTDVSHEQINLSNFSCVCTTQLTEANPNSLQPLNTTLE